MAAGGLRRCQDYDCLRGGFGSAAGGEVQHRVHPIEVSGEPVAGAKVTDKPAGSLLVAKDTHIPPHRGIDGSSESVTGG